jgi:DNA-binding NarL/FixJ family response regulator
MTPDELLAYALAGDGAPTDSERPTTTRSLGGLTMREMQVLRLGALGPGNREIVAELVLSPKTVERHLSHILAKRRRRLSDAPLRRRLAGSGVRR